MALREQTQRLLSQEDVTADNVEEMYGIEGIDLPDITAKDVGMFVAESTPIVGEAIALKRTSDALDEGDYVGAGIEATAGLLGLIPGVGDAAGKALRATTRKLRKDAKLKIDNPGFDEVYQETYAETKQRASDKVKNEAIEAGQTDTYETNIGTSTGVTGYANSVTFNPNELKDLPGAMGEEKFRSSGKKLDRLKQSIAERGYNPEDNNILIHVREDGQPFIVEGNHRLAEALESGRETITADIRYLRGAEEKAGPLDPRNIFPNQMVDDAPAPRMGYDPNNESSRVFHLTKADFDTADVIGSGTSDIGFHVGTAAQANARGSTNVKYDEDLAEQMVKDERILPMVLKNKLKPARIIDVGSFKEPKNWIANLSVPKKDKQLIKFLLDDPADADLLAKAPRVTVGGDTYYMLPDVMRSGMDEKLWKDIILEAHKARIVGLNTINKQEDRVEWFNTLKQTANKNGYDSFVYKNEYEGASRDTVPSWQEELNTSSLDEDSYMLLEPDQAKGLFGGMTEGNPAYMKNKGGLMLQKGGAVPMKEQMEMFEDGGLEQDGGTEDPVSGNDVPPGSSQEEVRDDIPAQLSEGEFVFPADVVRYIGLEKLMMMRQEAKMGLKMMDEMGQMGNSEEATIPDDLPFGVTDLIIVDGPEDVDNDKPKEYNVGGVVYGNQPAAQNMGLLYQQPQFQAGQTQIGMAADPIQMAPISRPQQQSVPVYQPPETLPDPAEFVSAPEGQAPQTIVIVNKETGEERIITFIPGVTEIPQGFVRKEDYVPEEVVPETPTTTVQTERVLSQDELVDREDADERRRQAEINQYGNASSKIGLKDFFGEGKDHIYGVNYVDGFGMGIMGVGQVLKGTIGGGDFPPGAMILLKNGSDEILLTGEEYTKFRNVVKAPGTDYSDITDLMDAGRKAARIASEAKRRKDDQAERERERGERDKQLEELARLEKSDERSSLIQTLQEERNTKKEQKKLAEAQAKAAAAAKKSADQLAAEARIRAKEQQQRNQQEDDDGPSYSKPTEYTMDTGFQDFTDFGGSSGPMAKGGLASKPKPKKRMKRGGLASKK